METIVIIISIMLIILVLLQSNKAEASSQIIQGGTSDLFLNRKERGGELFITRLTMFLGMAFFIICLFLSF
ncbi:MAG: preprotein translocase subunit SecG [bacterium]|nr:preprotein translocase subunit SecG [bacterium]